MTTAVETEKKTISVIIIEDFKLTRVGLRCALNSNEDIKVVAESDLKSKNRTYISLSVTGKSNAVYLKSENTDSGNNKGIYTTSALTTAASGEKLKLTSISAGQSGYLTLDGKAGEKNKATGASEPENVVNEGVSNSFTLMLKIKKATN